MRTRFNNYKRNTNDNNNNTNNMENKEAFNEWLRKIGNIYFADNEQMCNAYAKIN